MKFFLTLSLYITIALHMPHWSYGLHYSDANTLLYLNNNNNYYSDKRNGLSTTAKPATTATTVSPQFLVCFRQCPSAMQYNPVCGTDGENYYNEQRLVCAQFCGRDVRVKSMGYCGGRSRTANTIRFI